MAKRSARPSRKTAAAIDAAGLLLAAFDEALAERNVSPGRNGRLPVLYLNDPTYLADLSSLAKELRSLVAELKRSAPRGPKRAGPFAGHLNVFLESYAATLGKGAALLTMGAAVAVLGQLSGGHGLVLEVVDRAKDLG